MAKTSLSASEGNATRPYLRQGLRWDLVYSHVRRVVELLTLFEDVEAPELILLSCEVHSTPAPRHLVGHERHSQSRRCRVEECQVLSENLQAQQLKVVMIDFLL